MTPPVRSNHGHTYPHREREARVGQRYTSHTCARPFFVPPFRYPYGEMAYTNSPAHWGSGQLVKKTAFLNKFRLRCSLRPKNEEESLSFSCQRPLGTICRPPPQTPRKPSSTGIDTTLPTNELIQWLGIRFVGRRVTHEPRPLAPCPFVSLREVGGASNDGGKRVFPLRYF
jgi:hypothetical protein